MPVPSGLLATTSLPLNHPSLSFLLSDLTPISLAYLVTSNQWFPIFSPKRLFQEIKTMGPECRDPGMALLLSSIRLVSDTRFLGVCDEYRAAKELSSRAENEGIVSLRYLQALILLGVYEVGHAIYPAAYLTIGKAERLGSLIGLHDRRGATQLFKAADTWSVKEEERRAWWAVFILDRYSLSHLSPPPPNP